MFERKFQNPLVAAGANRREGYSVEELRALAGEKKNESEKEESGNGEKQKVPSARRETIQKEKEMTLSRRRFLVKLGLAAIVAAGSSSIIKKAVNFLSVNGDDKLKDVRKRIWQEAKSENKNALADQSADIEDIDLDEETILEDVPESTEELKEYIAEKEKEIGKLFDFNSNEPINLTQEIANRIKNEYWRVRYEKGILRKDYNMALKRMEPYDSKLEKVFRKEDVPAILKNISIAESHFQIGEVSRSGAAGPFQIMPKTAMDYGLKIDRKQGIDERKDPIKSAKAAARCIRDLYIKSKGVFRLGPGDWNIVKAGYNASFIWPYLRQCNGKKIRPNYDAFLGHFSQRLTHLREQIKKDPYLTVRIGSGDNLWKVYERFGIGVATLKKYNNKKSDKVRKGEIIKIPLKSFKDRKRIYDNLMIGYKENFMYVPKVNAVLEMRKQGVA